MIRKAILILCTLGAIGTGVVWVTSSPWNARAGYLEPQAHEVTLTEEPLAKSIALTILTSAG